MISLSREGRQIDACAAGCPAAWAIRNLFTFF
ncbi:hypothetical protein ACP_2156 [Acidobacterium capsulatum ATCC 51196]|uniref:Uncharacterized protein n=1 Tax=Acidobacterium capsulatum (strain ATCC 51196 / DSM 11244 / BCRC 80197 / JCM 7670 / NBRC 15755 / NCIMB 13165 / 161) TaxID=240015 RepID=C1F9J9_ACIC5|nr:hypothetical protein ACP_2156 [Acidobacterium capsulatum ATCC 51196]